MRFRIAWVVPFATLLAVVALGQTTASFRVTDGHFTGSASFSGPPPFYMHPVAGAPYSGEQVSEHVQTLADGTHITHTTPGMKMFRDSLGRTRTERQLFMGPVGANAADSPLIVEITDPVAGYQYTLDTVNHVAHRFALPSAGTQPGANVRSMAAGGGVGAAVGGSRAPVPAPRQADPTRPQFQSEQLGNQMIEGVVCEGRRTTTTIPAGAQGNDRPIVMTTETWMSPELKIMIMAKNSDPRSGENTTKMQNLSRLDPDPNLFQVPPGYTVVDEKGAFTITFK
jgi:hypothetical protein